MYIVELTYTQAPSAIEPLRTGHMQWVQQYFAQGLFLASGKKSTLDGGVILVQNMPKEALDAILATDPFASVADYRITQVNISSTQANLQSLQGQ